MKFILSTFVACIAAFSTYAQNAPTDSDTLKARKNNWATELNINPFKGELSLNNSLNQIKFRKFIADNFALRLGFNANRIGSTIESGSPYGTTPTIIKNERSSTTVGLNFGIEKHLSGTRRLSPYLGADLAFVDKSSNQELTNGSNKTTIKGAWRTSNYVPGPNGGYQQIDESEEAYFSYGINLTSGFDFYISRHFFFGYEFSFGFNSIKFKDIEVTNSGSTSNNTFSDSKNTAFHFGSNLFNGIRLGYVL